MKTIVVMVSIGKRDFLTDYTFKRLFQWGSKFNYSVALLKEDINYLDRSPHFNKLIVHKKFPEFERYIIVDDDLLISKNAPEIEPVPLGFVGLSEDAVQDNTENSMVSWTGNTGFIVADYISVNYLTEAYEAGEYPYYIGDGSNKGIWGPFDQATTNYTLFNALKIHKLDHRWNCQAIIEYYINGKGWERWKSNRLYRMFYYLKLIIPFTKPRLRLKSLFGLHMTMGVYPKFFDKIFN